MKSGKTGLVLEGGGARGAYQIGAYKSLIEEGYNFEGICGTSIGALNGALIAQGDSEKAYELWENIQPSELFGIPLKSWNILTEGGFKLNNLPELIKTLKTILDSKGLDIQNVKKLLKSIIYEDRIRKAPVDFGFVTYSLSDRKALEFFKEDVPEGKMIEYLLASANLPIFHMEKIEGKLLIDGGVYDNLPVQLLTKKDYHHLVIIRTYAPGVVKKITDNNLQRLLIEPSEDLGNILDFKPKNAKHLLNLGYFDVKRNFHHLLGKHYYIEGLKDENYYFDLLKSLCVPQMEDLAKGMNLQGMPPIRLMFEHILPLLSNALGLSIYASYEDIIMGVAEWMAKKLSIERFHLYPAEKFLLTIQHHPKARKIFPRPNKLPPILVKNELGAKVFKDRILQEISWFIIQSSA
jgi:NTE family protein